MLLSMRLRNQVDDDTFNRKRQEILERQTALQLKLEQPDLAPEDRLDRLAEILAFSRVAAEVFARATGDPVRRRLIVRAVTANWRSKNRKPLYEAKKPFSFLDSSRKIPLWLSVVEELRTWLLETDDFEPIPDLANASTMPQGTLPA